MTVGYHDIRDWRHADLDAVATELQGKRDKIVGLQDEIDAAGRTPANWTGDASSWAKVELQKTRDDAEMFVAVLSAVIRVVQRAADDVKTVTESCKNADALADSYQFTISDDGTVVDNQPEKEAPRSRFEADEAAADKAHREKIKKALETSVKLIMAGAQKIDRSLAQVMRLVRDGKIDLDASTLSDASKKGEVGGELAYDLNAPASDNSIFGNPGDIDPDEAGRTNIASWLPIVGDILDLGNAGEQLTKGNPKDALWYAAAAVVPGLGSNLLRQAGRKAGRKADEGGLPPHVREKIEAGNEFNRTRRSEYPHNEVRLENNKLVDSYNAETGEIVERKFTQMSEIQPETAKQYINDLSRKYPSGETIADTPANRAASPELVGKRLDGQQYLEVPPQNGSIPKDVLDHAKQHGILIRDTDGKIYR